MSGAAFVLKEIPFALLMNDFFFSVLCCSFSSYVKATTSTRKRSRKTFPRNRSDDVIGKTQTEREEKCSLGPPASFSLNVSPALRNMNTNNRASRHMPRDLACDFGAWRVARRSTFPFSLGSRWQNTFRCAMWENIFRLPKQSQLPWRSRNFHIACFVRGKSSIFSCFGSSIFSLLCDCFSVCCRLSDIANLVSDQLALRQLTGH